VTFEYRAFIQQIRRTLAKAHAANRQGAKVAKVAKEIKSGRDLFSASWFMSRADCSSPGVLSVLAVYV
jgi:hypothetical protein